MSQDVGRAMTASTEPSTAVFGIATSEMFVPPPRQPPLPAPSCEVSTLVFLPGCRGCLMPPSSTKVCVVERGEAEDRNREAAILGSTGWAPRSHISPLTRALRTGEASPECGPGGRGQKEGAPSSPL